MGIIKTAAMFGIPVLAIAAATSFASANDYLYADLEISSLATGTYTFDCGNTSTTGQRGHIQARARSQSAYFHPDVNMYELQSGTSQSVAIGPSGEGKRHIAYLESHLHDIGNGNERLLQKCAGSWTSGWLSDLSTGANISGCTANVSISTGQYSGACTSRSITAHSLGARD